MVKRVIKGLKKASDVVRPGNTQKPVRNVRPVTSHNEPLKLESMVSEDELHQAHLERPRVQEFVAVEVIGSKGQKYKMVVPSSIARGVPKVWEWTQERYRVAELIAQGVPYAQIPDHPDVGVKSRMTIYCWLNHPEFREHVDALTMETGFANKRERIAGLTRVTQKLFDKVVRELDSMKLTDKSIGAVLAGLKDISKQIAQEKEEFVEQQNIAQQTTIEGKVAVATVNLDTLIQAKPAEERKKLEEEFDTIGDDIIRSLTGGNE